MKKLLLLLLLCGGFAQAQDITGKWYGPVDLPTGTVRITIEVEQLGDSLAMLVGSPDQNNAKFPATEVSFADSVLSFSVPALQAQYRGTYTDGGTIDGTLIQRMYPMEVTFAREDPFKRPQEPVGPFPYTEEEVVFHNPREGLKLAGTLTIPEGEGPFPAVILVTGSGPQNRNSEIFGHKSFRVIADYLTRRGIAVLRYDERGIGESEGDFHASGMTEFADDATAALEYLRSRPETADRKVGVIGHSMGGTISFILAAREEADFIISLAGSALSGPELLRTQRQAIFSASGWEQSRIDEYNAIQCRNEEIVAAGENKETIEAQLREFLETTEWKVMADRAVAQMLSEEWYSIVRYDPTPDLRKISVPVLALNGELDLQVVPGLNLRAVEENVRAGGNDRVRTIEYPGLNHLFQTAGTGLMDEYAKIEETFNERVMRDMADWILGLW